MHTIHSHLIQRYQSNNLLLYVHFWFKIKFTIRLTHSLITNSNIFHPKLEHISLTPLYNITTASNITSHLLVYANSHTLFFFRRSLYTVSWDSTCIEVFHYPLMHDWLLRTTLCILHFNSFSWRLCSIVPKRSFSSRGYDHKKLPQITMIHNSKF